MHRHHIFTYLNVNTKILNKKVCFGTRTYVFFFFFCGTRHLPESLSYIMCTKYAILLLKYTLDTKILMRFIIFC